MTEPEINTDDGTTTAAPPAGVRHPCAAPEKAHASEAGGPAATETPSDAPGSSYDSVPYSVHAFAQTRPDRLAAIATLFGMHPAPPQRCRVLELGCASGGNLIPMGLSWPDSEFVGIDLSERQVRDGLAVREELKLDNVDLRCLSILDVTADLGMFDYILCHGVYSWVPPAVQEKILEICRDHLRPQGVAYISYNTFPGWHARAAIREMLCYHTEQFDDPAERIREARGLLTFLVRTVGAHDAAFNGLVRQELAVLAVTPDSYLLHEHLEEYNEPVYFQEFVDRAAGKDLKYLAEAQMMLMMASRLGPEMEQTLRRISPDLVHMEQYMDFLRNRMFRQTLLCHDAVQLDHVLRPESVRGMWVASEAKPTPAADVALTSDESMTFSTGDARAGTLRTRDALMKAAMLRLREVWPDSITFDDLVARSADGRSVTAEQTRQLAARLLQCFTSGLVEFSLAPPPMVTQVSGRPVASPYACLRAREEERVVNMRLESTILDPVGRAVLQHLDGDHDHAALVDLARPLLKPDINAWEHVSSLLHQFARAALLIA